MGGSAFQNFGLYTPRIPPRIYKYVLQKIKSELKNVFMRVEFAIEAPEKKSYGDIDFLVVPHPGLPVPPMDEVARHLGASNWFSPSGSSIHHLAIPWPEKTMRPRADAMDPESLDLESEDNISDVTDDDESTPRPSGPELRPITEFPPSKSPRHIQIDLTILPDKASLQWALFVNAHGDLISILSSIIRDKGLTINNQSFYVRMADLEAENRKLARIELTHDPNQVLTFLGLDIEQFWTPFATLDDMMRYIATCRYHNPKGSREDDPETQAGTTVAATNHGDDRRTHSRPAFNYWYDTFLPAHKNDPPGAQAHLSREEVLDLIFDFFGEDTKQRYFQRKQEAEAFVAKNRLWSDIRKQILDKQPEIEDAEMQQILKALRREIIPSTATALTCSADNTGNLDQYKKSSDSGQETSQKTCLAPVQLAYLNNDFHTVIKWAAENYITVLANYRTLVKENGRPIFPLDHRKANPFSKTELETYSSDDDRVISTMKRNGRSWGEILSVLGKKSRSQLQAHWKNDLDTQTVEGNS